MNPAFWSFDTAHLDSCQCLIQFLCNWSHLFHSTWEADFFTMVNDFTNRRNNSSCSAKTTLSEVFYFIEFNFSLLCLYSFIPDVAIPSMKNFCPNKNSSNSGRIAITVAASVGPYLIELLPTRIASPADSVRISTELVSIIG